MSTSLSVTQPREICFSQQEVRIVSSFKYLGTVIDQKLSFTENIDFLSKKAQQRLYLLGKLESFKVSLHILGSVHRSLTESVLIFGIVTWYGSLTVKNRTKLSRIVSIASKILGSRQLQLSQLYQVSVKRKTHQILNDYSPS